MDTKTFTIGILTTTAVILLTALVILQTLPQPAVASGGMTVTGGDFVMTVGRDSSGDQEFVYVIDGSSQRLIVYRFDTARKQIQIAQGLDLGELRSEKNPAQGRGRNRPGRRP